MLKKEMEGVGLSLPHRYAAVGVSLDFHSHVNVPA
jgi:hypothetical protein